MEEPKTKHWFSLDNKWLPIILIGGIASLWIINLVALMCMTDRGTFGDMFGAVNALFSGLAFGGIIYTILLQQKEMKIQSEEFRNQSKEFKNQNALMDKENFESTFFQMINSYEDTRKNFSKSLEITHLKMQTFGLGTNLSGLDNVGYWWRSFVESFSGTDEYGNVNYVLRHLNLIANFVVTRKVNSEDFYLQIIKSRIYDVDVVIIFYQMHLDEGDPHKIIRSTELFDKIFLERILGTKQYDAIINASKLK